MFVCICNAFSKRDVQTVIDSGLAKSVSCVYHHNECAAQCGQCAGMIRDMLAESGVLPSRVREA